MARYQNKPQALVDYAGVIGVAWLYVVKLGGYTMTILGSAGIAPSAVRARLDGCTRLLRAMGDAAVPWPPPGGGSGGSGAAIAELRVWPPSRRARSS